MSKMLYYIFMSNIVLFRTDITTEHILENFAPTLRHFRDLVRFDLSQVAEVVTTAVVIASSCITEQ